MKISTRLPRKSKSVSMAGSWKNTRDRGKREARELPGDLPGAAPAGGELVRGVAELFVHDLNARADPDLAKKLDDVAGAHPDAAKAGRPPDEPLNRRAMDVDAPVVSALVLRFKAAQPEDARDDRIAARRVR